MRTLNYVLIALMLSLGYSCENEALDDKNQEDLEQEVVYEVIDITDPVYQSILSQGFKAEDILADEDFYIVEGDILFSKSAIIEPQSDEKGVKHAHTTNLVAYSERYISVYLDEASFNSSALRSNLQTALAEVVEAYNSICDCYLHFNITTSSNADIRIYQEYLGFNICGQGSFPSSQKKAGNVIRLNESVISGLDVQRLIFLLAHECGHNIGLRHTDWNIDTNTDPYVSNLETAGGYGAINIPDTPDANSVMNKATCGFTWGDGFTEGDEDAIYSMYSGFRGGIEGPYELGCNGSGTWSINMMQSSGEVHYKWYYKLPGASNWVCILDPNGEKIPVERMGRIFWLLPYLDDDTLSMQFIIEDYSLLQLKVEVSDDCRTWTTIHDVWGNCAGGVLP